MSGIHCLRQDFHDKFIDKFSLSSFSKEKFEFDHTGITLNLRDAYKLYTLNHCILYTFLLHKGYITPKEVFMSISDSFVFVVDDTEAETLYKAIDKFIEENDTTSIIKSIVFYYHRLSKYTWWGSGECTRWLFEKFGDQIFKMYENMCKFLEGKKIEYYPTLYKDCNCNGVVVQYEMNNTLVVDNYLTNICVKRNGFQWKDGYSYLEYSVVFNTINPEHKVDGICMLNLLGNSYVYMCKLDKPCIVECSEYLKRRIFF